MDVIKKERTLSPDERDRYIVERLRLATDPVSGEALAGELGMSRVALWKRIESLKAWGYGIEASRKGYVLVRDDGLAGWELEAPGPVVLFDTVGSTMDEARRLAGDGASSGTTVLALKQSAGRGRNGLSWESPSGGLYLSVVLRSILPTSHAGALSLEAALSTVLALESVGVASVTFRWPGDIIVPGNETAPRKVGGVLLEAYGDIGAADYYIVGIGLNTAPDALTLMPARRAELAARIVRELVSWASDPVLDPSRWRPLAPDPRSAFSMRLWNGERRVIAFKGFNARGDLLPSDGGPGVSIGECRSMLYEGDSL